MGGKRVKESSIGHQYMKALKKKKPKRQKEDKRLLAAHVSTLEEVALAISWPMFSIFREEI